MSVQWASSTPGHPMQLPSLLLTSLALSAGLTALGGTLAARSSTDALPVPYPDGYRSWTHVKSALIGPEHPQFANMGGFTHIYANARAVEGYRTRAFPEGSVIAFDWIHLRENGGAFTEGARRQVDVMVRDSVRYRETGGWGFQRFVGDSHTELSTTLLPQQCFACHTRLARDGLVLSQYRP